MTSPGWQERSNAPDYEFWLPQDMQDTLRSLANRAPVLARAFRDGHGQNTAVVVHALAFLFAATLFNLIWWYARRGRRLLSDSIDDARRPHDSRASKGS